MVTRMKMSTATMSYSMAGNPLWNGKDNMDEIFLRGRKMTQCKNDSTPDVYRLRSPPPQTNRRTGNLSFFFFPTGLEEKTKRGDTSATHCPAARASTRTRCG